MEAVQGQREPRFGRFDLALLVHHVRPDEAARLLSGLKPVERALVCARSELRYAIAARETVDGSEEVLAITADDIFS